MAKLVTYPGLSASVVRTRRFQASWRALLAVIKGFLLVVVNCVDVLGGANVVAAPGGDGTVSPLSTSAVRAVRSIARSRLAAVKVASWYQSVSDYRAFDRTLGDVLTALEETGTRFVFRAFWRYAVVPERCSDLESAEDRARCELSGQSYAALENSVAFLKSHDPAIILSAGIPTERINARERDPITGEIFTREQTWAMALDPGKWGIPVSKEQFQENRARLLGFAPPDQPYDWRTAWAYYPDITNPDFQQLQLDWAKRVIDAGVDAVWIDMLFGPAMILQALTGDPNHPAVRDCYDAALRLVDAVHQYGLSQDRYVYVGGWTNFFGIGGSYPVPDFDFVVVLIWESEVASMMLNDERWNIFFDRIASRMGRDVLILPFMDEAATRWQDQPLGIFSQELTSLEQNEFLRRADRYFFAQRCDYGLPIVFVYPLHGGWMGSNAATLAYGQFPVYDALAPEFDTYETIRELARTKLSDSCPPRWIHGRVSPAVGR